MSKKTEEVVNGAHVDETPKSSPINELKKNGSITLTANSREELFEKFESLKASAKDVTLMTGAVGQVRGINEFKLLLEISKESK